MQTTLKNKRKQVIFLGQIEDLKKEPNAHLFLLKPHASIFGGFNLIKFATREALEAFNKKAGLCPLVYSYVPKNYVVWRHQKEIKE